MSYSFDSRIRFSETGEDGQLTIQNIVNYFQDCSTFHSEQLEMGVAKLQEKDRVWILSSWQIDIIRRPVVGEEVKIVTWPYDFKGFYGYRNFVLETVSGEQLAYANSIWVYLDTQTGKPVKIDTAEANGYSIEARLAMDYAPRKVNIPKESEERESFKVQQGQIDIYHHVNNGKYIAMANEYLPADFTVRQMRVEYKNQAKLGSTIIPLVNKLDKQITVVLCDEAKEPYAVIEFSEA